MSRRSVRRHFLVEEYDLETTTVSGLDRELKLISKDNWKRKAAKRDRKSKRR